MLTFGRAVGVVALAGGMVSMALGSGLWADGATRVSDPAAFREGTAETSEQPSYTYACPPSWTLERGNGICIGTLQRWTESLTEPFLAVHPTLSDVFVVGTNEAQTAQVLSPDTVEDEGIREQLIGIYVSEDGGASWERRSPPPLPPGPPEVLMLDVTSQWDPALAFDSEGALHALIMDTALFYVSSSDLGRTWSSHLSISDSPGDRPWITTGSGGEVLVTWTIAVSLGQDPEIEVVWSRDGGRAWQISREPDCRFPSPIVRWNGKLLLACSGVSSGQKNGARVLEFNLQTGAFTEQGRVAAMTGSHPMIEALADGGLVLVADDQQACDPGMSRLLVARAEDASAWSEPVDVFASATLDDGWLSPRHYWQAADPWGNLHILVSGFRPLPEHASFPGNVRCNAAWVVGTYSDEITTGHLVVDGSSLSVVHESELTPEQLLGHNRVPPAMTGISRAGDFFGLAFGGGRGVLVWEYERGLDYTIVERR